MAHAARPLKRSDADLVALGSGGVGVGDGLAVEAGQHAPDDAPVDGADDRVLHGRVPEWTVLGDDRLRSVTCLGVGRQSVVWVGVCCVMQRGLSCEWRLAW